jgi:DNA polymerase III epsilon subunit-like protein
MNDNFRDGSIMTDEIRIKKQESRKEHYNYLVKKAELLKIENLIDDLNDVIVIEMCKTESEQIIKITICDLEKKVLFSSLIYTSHIAENIHGITQEMLEDAPSFQEVLEKINPLIKDKIIFTWIFDQSEKLFYL